jgi:hypothetical protein
MAEVRERLAVSKQTSFRIYPDVLQLQEIKKGRVEGPGDAFFYSSTLRHYLRLILQLNTTYITTCFGRTNNFRHKIYNSLRITQLTTDPLFFNIVNITVIALITGCLTCCCYGRCFCLGYNFHVPLAFQGRLSVQWCRLWYSFCLYFPGRRSDGYSWLIVLLNTTYTATCFGRMWQYCLLLLKWQTGQCILVTTNDVIVIDVSIIV